MLLFRLMPLALMPRCLMPLLERQGAALFAFATTITRDII